VRPPSNAVTSGQPGAGGEAEALRSGNYDVEMWKKLRQSVQGKVSIPDKKSGLLIQADGEEWRNLRTGLLPKYGAFALGATLVALVLFFLLRGRIRIEHGLAGRTITRFSDLERTGHWLLAISFIALALTGLNVLYGRALVMPLIGKEAFAALSGGAKLVHNYVAFAFMAGLALTFLMWLRHNFPNRHDVVWLLKLGGLFSRHSHPPARKFNAGQKILFWLVILGGVVLSVTGIALMFPFETELVAGSMRMLAAVGLPVPTELTPLQEMQLAATAHGTAALVLACIILGHIYIGTIGMQGAFAAMGSGEVDLNWAKEHHALWAEEELAKEREALGGGTRIQAAE
jgi:formate dehydrogenase subunit gamma